MTLPLFASVAVVGCSLAAKQKGLHRSITKKALPPLDHLQEALALERTARLVDMPSFNSGGRHGIREHASTGATGCYCLLVRSGSVPSPQSVGALLEIMDVELELFDRGPGALRWWCQWLQAPAKHLTMFVPAALHLPRPPPTITYTDASTDFGLGSVLLLPDEVLAFLLRTRVLPRDRTDRLEVEAATIADAVFGPIIWAYRYVEEISFVHNKISLSWLTRGCSNQEDPMLAGPWLQVDLRHGFKWWELYSGHSTQLAVACYLLQAGLDETVSKILAKWSSDQIRRYVNWLVLVTKLLPPWSVYNPETIASAYANATAKE